MDDFPFYDLIGLLMLLAWVWAVWAFGKHGKAREDCAANYSLLDWQMQQSQEQQIQQSTWTHFKTSSSIIPSDFNEVKGEQQTARKCVNCGATAKGKCEYCGSEE